MTTSDDRFPRSRLHTRNTTLAPLAPEHLPALRSLELEEDIAFRWRHAGVHPNPADFMASAFDDVLCSFLVHRGTVASTPRGLVSAYHADLRNGHVRVAVTHLGLGHPRDPSVAIGTLLFFDYLFTGWPFRKLYFEIPECNLMQLSGVRRRLLTEEARLAQYFFLG